MTMAGQFVGSLPWASPEQAEGHAERVDVRSDVFSLGVILFQLLTGTLPHTTAGSLRAVLERIGRDPVPRPSSRHAGLDGEIDTLVLTCLAKEPERRYQTVNELAADIENSLAHRPIASKRDSYWYVVRKAVARRRLPVAIGSAFLLVIVGGLAASLVFWRQAAYQRDRAAHAEAVAQEEARRAHASAQRSQTTCDFLRETLATVDPMRIGREVRVADLLADAASRLDAAFPGDSVERADLEDALGRAYQALGLYDEAEPHRARALEVRRRVLGDEHPDTLSALEAVGELHELQRQGEVLPFVQTAFEARRRLLGPDDPDTLHSMNYLAFLYRRAGNSPRAEELQLEALSRLRRVRGENDRETLNCLANLAWLRESQGRLDDSATLFQEALDGECAALGEADPDTMDVRDHYGRILRELGRLEECEATFRHNLYLRRSVHGPEHPETLAAASNLAVALHIRGELAEAEALQRSVIAARKRVERPNFPDILFSLVSLTQILIDSGRPGEAIDVAQEAVTLSANLENPDPRHRANALRALGAALLAAGDAAAAEPWLCEAWDFWRGASVNDRRRTLAESDYGACLTALGRFADAEPLLVETNRAIQADPGVSELTRERSRERLRKMMCAPARSAGLEHDVQSDVESAQHGL